MIPSAGGRGPTEVEGWMRKVKGNNGDIRVSSENGEIRIEIEFQDGRSRRRSRRNSYARAGGVICPTLGSSPRSVVVATAAGTA